MRTRFLNTDYFSAPATSEALRDFQAVTLPAPDFSSPDPSTSLEIALFDPDSSIHHDVDKLPIEKALADFLSDVIPEFHRIGGTGSANSSPQMPQSSKREPRELGSGANEAERIESAGDFIYEEIEVDGCSEFSSGASGTKFIKPARLFETSEVEDFLLVHSRISSKENESVLFFEIPGISVPLDKVEVVTDTPTASPCEIATLSVIDSIADMAVVNQELSFVKEGNTLRDDGFHLAIELPCFEVGKSCLGLHENLSMGEIFNNVLAYLMTQKNDELTLNAKDFLGSINVNISDHFPTHLTSEDGLEHEPLSQNSLLELHLINLNGNVLLEKRPIIYPVIPDGSLPLSPCSVSLEEIQVIDRTPVYPLDIFNNFQTLEKEDFWQQMYNEEVGPIMGFYQSVVASELSLVDDVFKSLPAPVFSDEKVKLSSSILEDLLNALKPHSFSTCDGIYLDWHPLSEGMCNHESCSTFVSMLQEVSDCTFDTAELKATDRNNMLNDIDLMDDSSGVLSLSEFKETLEDAHDAVVLPVEPDAIEIPKDVVKLHNSEKQKREKASAKTPLPETVSESNDLNFFLNLRKGGVMSSGNGTSHSQNDPGSQFLSFSNSNVPSEPPTFSGSQLQKIEVHEATLSYDMLGLINHVQEIYFYYLNKCKHLISSLSSSTSKDYELRIPKQKLLELIAKESGSQIPFGAKDEAFISLLAVYALKQLVYYLCFFGFHIAYVYVSNLSTKVNKLAKILRPLKSMLQNVHSEAEQRIIESHPSLPLIQGILLNTSPKHKTLIISDELFGPALKQMLTFLRVAFHEDRHALSVNSNLESLSHVNCFLLSYEYISASFPIMMFSNILEYGGPHPTSLISELFPTLGGVNCVHFIKMSLENHCIPMAFCQGFDAPRNPGNSMEDLQGFVSEESVAKILSHVPLDMPCSSPSESADKTEVSNVNEYAMNIFHLSSSSNLTAKSSSFLEVLIIANTQNYEKNMIMSRRSSYQKILALEKGGVQVVERDINLPLDLILSAAVCLVWYETRNIGDGSEAFANVHSVPAFIENIATKILMSLSSSFSCCILVFEGESNFLASIMELSDMLYAAAASLDLNLQLFCSPLPESTDEIILNCIRTTNFLDRGLYPPMPESESLAESFLTRFPSLNPLSAHAILSSGGMLVDFLEWSHERRMQAVGKYKMPAESISLFNALCRFGELGESKSVMTDCSSIDSDNSGGTLQPERKRQRYGLKSRNSSMPMDESFYFQPNLLNHSRILHKNPDINSSKISNLVGNKLLGRSQQHEELINYNDNFLDEQYASISRSEFNLNKSELKSEPPIRSFLPSSRISLGHSNSFPKSLDLRSEEDWVSFDHKHGLEKETCRLKTTSSNPHLPTKKTKCDNRPADGLGLFTKEEKTPNFSDFLPSNSIQSFQRSILTTEFLSRVNDKRRMPQQPSYKKSGSSKGKAAYQKRSPSIIDSFRFQGGSQHVKEAVNRRNLPRELSKESALITPTWTPVDKRARQNLSFMRNGNEKQSRLVWRRRDSPRVDCSLSTRHRGEF